VVVAVRVVEEIITRMLEQIQMEVVEVLVE
jgi:hypothetical protein